MQNKFLQKLIIAIAIVAGLAAVYWSVDTFILARTKPVSPLASGTAPAMTTAPPFELKDINGKMISPALFHDKVIIVNFWASWCAPCVEEIPSLLKLVELYKNDVALVALSGDETEADIVKFLKDYNLEGLPVYVAWDDGGAIARMYGTKKLPESYIFKRKNEFFLKIEGIKNWHSPAFIKTFEGLVRN